jgi:hypothetical protein
MVIESDWEIEKAREHSEESSERIAGNNGGGRLVGEVPVREKNN